MKCLTLAKAAFVLLCGNIAFASTAMAAPPRCDTSVAVNWSIPALRGDPATTLRVIGRSVGARCSNATLTYTILNARGRVLFRNTYNATSVAPFMEVRTPSQMRVALTDWIRPTNRAQYKASLPDWPVGADGPLEREFGFTPAETMTREEYLGIKSDRTPLRCYVQGVESINCVIYHGGVIDTFGVQAFPG